MTNQYEPHEIKVANDIATKLNDQHSLHLHLQFVRQYPEEFLRKQLAEVLAVPPHKIIKNRAALYVSLVKRNWNRHTESSADTDVEHIGDRCPLCGQEYL